MNFCIAESVYTDFALLEALPISLYRRRQFEELRGRRYVWTLSPSHVSEFLARFLQKTDSSHPTTQLFPLKKQLKTKTKRKKLKASRSFSLQSARSCYLHRPFRNVATVHPAFEMRLAIK